MEYFEGSDRLSVNFHFKSGLWFHCR